MYIYIYIYTDIYIHAHYICMYIFMKVTRGYEELVNAIIRPAAHLRPLRIIAQNLHAWKSRVQR